MGAHGGMGRRRFLGVAATGMAATGIAAGSAAAGNAVATPPLQNGQGQGNGDGHGRPTRTRPCYLGTYTSGGGGGTGIGLATYQPETGQLTSTGVIEGVADPSFLALARGGQVLYAVNEQDQGAVTAIALGGGAGGPVVLGSESTGGAAPCHLSVHPGGRYLLSANYGSGSVAVHPIREDASLGARTDLVQHTGSGPDPDRQTGPHAHQVITDPDGAHVLAVDLGSDRVHSYRLDERTGRLAHASEAATRPGAGPRHLAFHPSGRFVYLANELDNTIAVCGYESGTGKLSVGTPQPTAPKDAPAVERNYPSEVLVSADGRFVYLANRGLNGITRYAVGDGGATLTLLDAVPVGGDYPRHTAFSNDGKLLFAANQKSGSVTTFTVDGSTGELAATGSPFAAPAPVCVLPG
ncbi:lactonase family protein [Streptomyces sp. 8N616]|uniref:lactonase family protein n=1 Tax=Streptomyces sp. 8N616 TaxID=3457414 RepID=UPI003FD3E645